MCTIMPSLKGGAYRQESMAIPTELQLQLEGEAHSGIWCKVSYNPEANLQIGGWKTGSEFSG
jgi:hypothetical protein